MAELIRPSTVLPAKREAITIITSDGLHLIGEFATPENDDRSRGILCLHPLPTHGGMMDSHIYKKAANRLPALAGISVVRFTLAEQKVLKARARVNLVVEFPSAPMLSRQLNIASTISR